jgi:nicotinamidase-related amidase
MQQVLVRSALLLIDVQKGFREPIWGRRNNLDAEANMAILLSTFRKLGGRVLHVQHMSVERGSPLRPGQPGNDFMEFAKPLPGETVFQKTVNSSFIGTRLIEVLREENLNAVVIAGLTTDHCVSTSARMASNLGIKTFVIADATATFDRRGFDGKTYDAAQVHTLALASLHREFSTVTETKSIIQQMRKDGDIIY